MPQAIPRLLLILTLALIAGCPSARPPQGGGRVDTGVHESADRQGVVRAKVSQVIVAAHAALEEMHALVLDQSTAADRSVLLARTPQGQTVRLYVTPEGDNASRLSVRGETGDRALARTVYAAVVGRL